MKRLAFVTSTIVVSTVFVVALLFAQPQGAAIAIRGARVVDGTGAPAKLATVLIRGERIEAVGENVAIPAGARVIDAQGLTLIPGLFDLHTHLQSGTVTGLSGDLGKNLKAYLAAGVTTVVNFSGSPETFEPIRRLVAEGVLQSPRLLLSARFSPPGGHGTEGGESSGYEPATADQAHAFMREALRYKPDAIKAFTDGWRYGSGAAMTDFNEQTTAAIAADAHAAGIKVLTHTVTLANSKISARAGIDVQAHGICDVPADEEVIRIYKEKGTGYVSTLECYRHQERFAVLGTAPLSPRLTELIEPAALPAVPKSDVFARSTPASRETAVKRWAALVENIRRLHAAGIPIGTGTDSGVVGIHHGYATLQEVQLLVGAGLTPLEAIHSATGVSARLISVDASRGTIEAGKLADLVLVAGEPDRKIEDIENTRRVFLGGQEIDLAAIGKAIHSNGLTELPAHKVAALVYDAEAKDGFTNLGTRIEHGADRGVDHSTVTYTTVLRGANDHSLFVLAGSGPRDPAYVRLKLPLTRGSVELADIGGYRGVSFDVRGEGGYRLLLDTYGVRDQEQFAAGFEAGGTWRTVKIDFTQLKRKTEHPVAWTGRDARELQFEIARPAGTKAWLELDNVRFY
jgi:imidazolonepropionase-like amidohydrolase